MRVELLTVGHELLDGRVLDSNVRSVAHALARYGIELARRTSVPDDIDQVVGALEEAQTRQADLCLVTGGLGPTVDDLTREAFARWRDIDLLRDAPTYDRITAWLESNGREMTAEHARQAEHPAGSTPIANPEGSACGFRLRVGEADFVALPGVPRELEAMLPQVVLDSVPTRSPPEQFDFVSFGLAEANVDACINRALRDLTGIRVCILSDHPEVLISLVATERDAPMLDALTGVRRELGDHLVSEDGSRIPDVVVQQLLARRKTVAVAESCTGGLLSDLFARVSGASGAFQGGVVAYSNTLKEQMLGVSRDALLEYGAVSEPVARAMAVGARERCGSDYALSVTGVAGPTGGTERTPVGTVCLGLACEDRVEAMTMCYRRDRNVHRRQSAFHALGMLWHRLKGDETCLPD